jgi:Rod binding domain-containing protein
MSSLAPIVAGLAGSGSPTSLPAVNETHAPASVREGSTAVKQAYATAQGFEEMLLQQLSQSLAQTSGLSGEGETEASEGSGQEGSLEAGGEGGSSMLSSLLPQTLTEGIMHGGGIGLAAQMMDALDPSAARAPASGSPASAGVTGGAGAPASIVPSAHGATAPVANPTAIGSAGGASAPASVASAPGVSADVTSPAVPGPTGGASA